jgi:hypothetical protein
MGQPTLHDARTHLRTAMTSPTSAMACATAGSRRPSRRRTVSGSSAARSRATTAPGAPGEVLG